MIDANSQFFAILTNVGMAKQANADALGIPWKITDMGVGDANGTDPIPNAAQTALIHEWRRRPLNQLKIDPNNPAVIIAEQIIPADEGGKWIREIGLYDADGDLVAVANCAPSFKPALSQGSGRTQIVRMNFIVTSAGNITLKIDPAIVLASRVYVDAAILEVLPANKTPGVFRRVTVNNRGVVVSGDNPETLAGFGIKDTYTKPEIESMIAQASALPVGTMVGFPVNKVPPGFLEIDGSVQSIATYPDLATFLGTAFNQGNEGAGNFRLPESRGEFLRGWDHGRGIDAGRAVGSYQLDMLKSHTHEYSPMRGSGVVNSVSSKISAQSDANADNGATTGATGGAETRPRNLAVMWCIKAWNAPINQGNIDVAALASEVEKTRNLSIQGASRGILISATGVGSLISARVDQVIVKDGAGVARRISSLSAAINLATVGANGLDTGALAASSCYSLWAINGAAQAFIASLCPVMTGSTTAGSAVVTGLPSTASVRVGMQLSGSAFPAGSVVQSIDSPSQINVSALALTTTAAASLRFVYEPVLPVGYTSKARVGMFLTGSNGVPYAYTQIDNVLLFDPTAGSNTLNYPVAVSGVASTPVSVSLANLVPPTARKVSLVAGCSAGYVGFAPEGSFASTPGTGYLSPQQLNGFPFAGGYNAAGPVPTAQGEFILRRMSFLYCATAATAVAQVMGWEDGL
ncbi:phage tail protein [Pseudomonas hormoni]